MAWLNKSPRGLCELTIMASKAQHRSFDVALKLRAVEFAVKNGKEAAARKFNMVFKWIREWYKQKQKLLKLKIMKTVNEKKAIE